MNEWALRGIGVGLGCGVIVIIYILYQLWWLGRKDK